MPTYSYATKGNLRSVVTTLRSEMSVPSATSSVSGTVKYDDDTIKRNANGQLYVDIPSLMGVSY